MTEPEKSSTPAGAPNPDAPKKDHLATAVQSGKAAVGWLGRMWKMARFFLPKKWTPKTIAITAIVVVILVMFIWFLIQQFLWWLKFGLIVAFALAGLYFIFGPKPKG
ncbi:MAG: hypothetical protein AB7K09_05885 [Planctomycetota bacterium]